MSLDSRAQEARHWALERLQRPGASFAPASADASFRRYFRIVDAGQSWILMDAPPAQENCLPFVQVAGLLQRWGLNVPRIIGQDLNRGFLLLSDLGRETYLQVMNEDNADRLFGEAIDALVRMQAAAAGDAQTRSLPAYDAALLWREVRLFPEWYLGRHLGVRLEAEAGNRLEKCLGLLVQAALAQPRSFVHRDYMPRNLMVSDPAPGILDFQDAVYGPITYDVISLFKDAFRSWPDERIRGWVQQYWTAARAAGLPVAADMDMFWRQLDWMGLQRHLKVLGIFARLTHRDGKPQYVADTPRFVRYVMDVAPRYPELIPLVQVFQQHVLPKVAV